MTNPVHCWHSVRYDSHDSLTTAPLDPTIYRCPVCEFLMDLRTSAESTLIVPPEPAPLAETKAARQRRINLERLRETAAERRREQRALARSGRVA